MKNYDEFIKTYIDTLDQTDKLFFIIEKCCGYGFPLIVPKYISTKVFHEMIRLETRSSNPVNISTSIENLKKHEYINNSNTNIYMTIYNDILNKNIKPIYDLPDPVVYKLYVDLCSC